MRSKDNAQYMVGIPRDSAMHRFYQDEAKAQQVKLPTYIYQLLRDRYEALQGGGSGLWFPRGVTVSHEPMKIVEPVNVNKASVAVQMFGGEDED